MIDKTREGKVFSMDDIEIRLIEENRYSQGNEPWIGYTFRYKDLDLTIRNPELGFTLERAVEETFDWIKKNPSIINSRLEESRRKFAEDDYIPGRLAV